MKKMIKLFGLFALISSVGITYTILTFSKLLEDVDFFEDEQDEDE